MAAFASAQPFPFEVVSDSRSLLSPQDKLRGDVVIGMVNNTGSKWIRTQHLYNPLNALLYDQIAAHPAYYPKIAEEQLLEKFESIAPILMELEVHDKLYVASLGPGSGHKDLLLLQHLLETRTFRCVFNPIDVDKIACATSAELLSDFLGAGSRCIVDLRSSGLEFVPGLHASRGVDMPRLITYFGSSFGNFAPPYNQRHLQQIVGEMYIEDFLLIGIDMQSPTKPIEMIEAAYNTEPTVEWVMNLLDWMNITIGTDFNRGDFHYRSFWDPELSGMHTQLVANKRVVTGIPDTKHVIRFEAGEPLSVEVSMKYTEAVFRDLVRQADLEVVKCVRNSTFGYNLYLLRTIR